MLDIQRVKMVCKWLIFNDYADNDSELAKLMGYTKSSFSQIMNGKVPLSSKFIDKLCNVDQNINKVWVFTGKGDMLRKEVSTLEISIEANNITIKGMQDKIDLQDEIISSLKQVNSMQAKELIRLEHELQDLKLSAKIESSVQKGAVEASNRPTGSQLEEQIGK
jgi:transcriptional regulator with XRE-family HTH domain